MVRVLISLRSTVFRHQVQRSSAAPLIIAGVLGLVSAVGTLLLGLARHGDVRADLDILSAVFALWLGGQVVQASLAGGDAALRPEMLALLPLPRRRLAFALLVVGLADPVLVLLAVAYAALVAVGVRSGLAGTAVALAATVLTVLLTAVLSTIAAGILGPGARRGRDAGTIVVAMGLSVLALSGTLLPSIVSALDEGGVPWLSGLVRVLPSGWGGDAVAAASSGNWLMVATMLGALVVLVVVAAALWPAILQRRMIESRSGASDRTRLPRHRLLPATPVGAVTAKEMRLWTRDPIRLTCLLIALVVGVGVGLIPRLTGGTTLLMPFAGPLTVIIAAACACNLYGSDGTSLWLTMMTPSASTADVRGRQLAWLLIVAPFAGVETVVLTALSGRSELWPWALATLVALVGGGAGLVPFSSLISVQPLDDAGNPTPAFSLKVHAALVVVCLTAVPAVAVLIAVSDTRHRWLAWSAVPVAIVTGALLLHRLGAIAARRLESTQVAVLLHLT